MRLWIIASCLLVASLASAQSVPDAPLCFDLQAHGYVACASTRSPLLTGLYAGFIGTNVLDTVQTFRGGSAHEANPILGGAADSLPILIAWKAAFTAGPIVLAERIRKAGHPRAAVFTMIALDSAYLSVTAHNARITR